MGTDQNTAFQAITLTRLGSCESVTLMFNKAAAMPLIIEPMQYAATCDAAMLGAAEARLREYAATQGFTFRKHPNNPSCQTVFVVPDSCGDIKVKMAEECLYNDYGINRWGPAHRLFKEASWEREFKTIPGYYTMSEAKVTQRYEGARIALPAVMPDVIPVDARNVLQVELANGQPHIIEVMQTPEEITRALLSGNNNVSPYNENCYSTRMASHTERLLAEAEPVAREFMERVFLQTPRPNRILWSVEP